MTSAGGLRNSPPLATSPSMRHIACLLGLILALAALGCRESTTRGSTPTDGGVATDTGSSSTMDGNGGGACDGPAAPEDNEAACGNGCDDDGDGLADCDDFGCAGLGACTSGGSCDGGVEGPENTLEACTDGCSNDGDRYVDCDDFDCAGIGECPARGEYCEGAPTHENTPEACSDSCSNDLDLHVDCDDFDCAGIGTCPALDGGVGGVQCTGPLVQENTVETCADGCSNDGNNFADCDDFGCAGIGDCPARDGGMPSNRCTGPISRTEDTPEMCSDDCSNDGDSYVDCDDHDCAGIGACPAMGGGA